jgi:predicted dehydrogenase
MTDPINWGVLGAAKFARNFMGPAIHAASGARLAAVASSSGEKIAEFRKFCPDIQVHSSYEALLADPDIHAVYIPLPNHMHVEWALRAMDAGKHVLCEKPMALHADEFDELIAKRDATGLLAAEAYMIVHHPQWQLARDLVQGGEIGQLVRVSGAFSFDNRADTDNIRNHAKTGGGALRDIGVYTIGAARFVTGQEPVSVDADITWENGIDVFSDVRARFKGFSYGAYVSIRAHLHQEMTFHGDAGLIRLTAPFNAGVFGEAQVEVHRPGLTVQTTRFPAADQYVLQVESFGRTIRGQGIYPCPLEFSRATQAMMDAAFAASPEPS